MPTLTAPALTAAVRGVMWEPVRPHPLSGAAWAGRRVGLLGGSFNPAHAGHRHISLHALRALGLDQVWWLVTPQNPLKSTRDMAEMPARLDRARRVARHPRLVVTDLEQRLGTRYTADTLAALGRRFSRTRFVWLIGADNLSQMPRWHRWRAIFAQMPVAVFNRPPYSFRALAGRAARRLARWRVASSAAGRLAYQRPPAWVFRHDLRHPASATAIRLAGKDVNAKTHEVDP